MLNVLVFGVVGCAGNKPDLQPKIYNYSALHLFAYQHENEGETDVFIQNKLVEIYQERNYGISFLQFLKEVDAADSDDGVEDKIISLDGLKKFTE